MKSHARLIAALAAVAITLWGCGPKTANQKTPPPPEGQKTCSATVVAPGTPTQQCTGGCPDELKTAGNTVTKPCTGEKQDQCPLTKSYTEGCPQLDQPVDPKATCTATLKDITACK